MTPEPVPQPQTAKSGIALCAPLGGSHLTSEQFGEMLARSATEDAGAELALAEAHLLVCQACAAELASLREAIALFREASSAYADTELRRIPRWIPPDRRVLSHTVVPAYWVAAAAMFLTAILPLQVLRRHAATPAVAVASSAAASDTASSAQSDEALLDDVNREIAATVPAPMQALADPTASAATASTAPSNPALNQGDLNQGDLNQGASTQRKDQP